MIEMNDEQLGKWCREHTHAYMCDDCERTFYLEEIFPPSEVTCPYCNSDEVAINSADYGKLDL
jgi:DNA-directed RNA polymerase subunit RPC12/RpoP